MTLTPIEANQLYRDELQRKLRARQRSPGYEGNCRDIEAEITRLDEEIARQRAQGPEAPPPQPPS